MCMKVKEIIKRLQIITARKWDLIGNQLLQEWHKRVSSFENTLFSLLLPDCYEMCSQSAAHCMNTGEYFYSDIWWILKEKHGAEKFDKLYCWFQQKTYNVWSKEMCMLKTLVPLKRNQVLKTGTRRKMFEATSGVRKLAPISGWEGKVSIFHLRK